MASSRPPQNAKRARPSNKAPTQAASPSSLRHFAIGYSQKGLIAPTAFTTTYRARKILILFLDSLDSSRHFFTVTL